MKKEALAPSDIIAMWRALRDARHHPGSEVVHTLRDIPRSTHETLQSIRQASDDVRKTLSQADLSGLRKEVGDVGEAARGFNRATQTGGDLLDLAKKQVGEADLGSLAKETRRSLRLGRNFALGALGAVGAGLAYRKVQEGRRHRAERAYFDRLVRDLNERGGPSMSAKTAALFRRKQPVSKPRESLWWMNQSPASPPPAPAAPAASASRPRLGRNLAIGAAGALGAGALLQSVQSRRNRQSSQGGYAMPPKLASKLTGNWIMDKGLKAWGASKPYVIPVLGSMLAARAVQGVAGMVDNYARPRQEESAWNKLVKRFPEYEGDDAAREQFSVIYDFNPSITRHPVVVHSQLRGIREIDDGHIPINTIDTGTRIERARDSRPSSSADFQRRVEEILKKIEQEHAGGYQRAVQEARALYQSPTLSTDIQANFARAREALVRAHEANKKAIESSTKDPVEKQKLLALEDDRHFSRATALAEAINKDHENWTGKK